MKSLVITLALSVMFWTTGFAEDPHGGADMQKMMEMCAELAKPGKEHAEFAKCSGDWTYTSKAWWVPGQPATDGSGTRKVSTVFGGRYMKFEDSGDMGGGMKMNGMGLIGYDNFNKVYQMFWVDDMSTMMIWAEGTASADGKTITLMGTMDDPMTGQKDQPVRYVTKMPNETEHQFEIWAAAGTPQEYKMLEISYKKK